MTAEDKTGPARAVEKTSTGGGGHKPLKKAPGGTPPPTRDTSKRTRGGDPMKDWPNLRKVPVVTEWAALLSPDQGTSLDGQTDPRPMQDHPGGSHIGTMTSPGGSPQGRIKGRKDKGEAREPASQPPEVSPEEVHEGLPGSLPLYDEEPKDQEEDDLPGQMEDEESGEEPQTPPILRRKKRRAAIKAQPVPSAFLNASIQSPSSGRQDTTQQAPLQQQLYCPISISLWET